MSKLCTVYFIRCGRDGPIKIGATKGNPLARLKELQPLAPYELVLIGAFSGCFKEERRLQDMFREHKRWGEWFDPAPKLISYAEQYAPSATESLKDFGQSLADEYDLRHAQWVEWMRAWIIARPDATDLQFSKAFHMDGKYSAWSVRRDLLETAA